jgi:hypothetical protein
MLKYLDHEIQLKLMLSASNLLRVPHCVCVCVRVCVCVDIYFFNFCKRVFHAKKFM